MEQQAEQWALYTALLRHLTMAHRPASKLYASYARALGEEDSDTQRLGELVDQLQTHMIAVAELLQHGEGAFDA